MRVLTLTQPWATLVAIGEKEIETRSWATSYRGPLAIHAASGLGPVGGQAGLVELCLTEPFRSALIALGCLRVDRRHDIGTRKNPAYFHIESKVSAKPAYSLVLPRGAIVAVCELADIKTIEAPMRGRTWIIMEQTGLDPATLTEQERAFGDYADGRYAWLLADVRRLPEPIPCSGAQRPWTPDTLTAMVIQRQLIAGV
jgi:activating signal cointegrator 1